MGSGGTQVDDVQVGSEDGPAQSNVLQGDGSHSNDNCSGDEKLSESGDDKDHSSEHKDSTSDSGDDEDNLGSDKSSKSDEDGSDPEDDHSEDDEDQGANDETERNEHAAHPQLHHGSCGRHARDDHTAQVQGKSWILHCKNLQCIIRGYRCKA